MPNVNDELEADDSEDRLYDDTPWKGVSCASPFWPYSQREALFETRRAVTNLTGGLPYALDASILASIDDVSATDIMSFVKAADDVRKAANITLNEVVAEAISRGATWTQIGEALGVQRTAAQKRFGKGVQARRKAELQHEATSCLMLWAFWSKQVPIESLGLDSSDRDAVPIETAFSYAVRSINKAMGLCQNLMSNGESSILANLLRIYDLVRSSLHLFLIPEALDLIVDHDGTEQHDVWADFNAPTYFVQAISHVAAAFHHFRKILDNGPGDDVEATKKRIAYIYCNLVDAMEDFSRPECIGVMKRIEQVMSESGDAVYTDWREGPPTFSPTEIFQAIWRKDKVKMAELLGVDKIEDVPSLDELLDS